MGKSKFGFPFRTQSRPPHESLRQISFSDQIIHDNIAAAESIITKWSIDSSSDHCIVSSLFSEGGRHESSLFLCAIFDLQNFMLYFSSPKAPDSPSVRSVALLRSQSLMQSAIRRLEHEFSRLLGSLPQTLDPDSFPSSLFQIISDLHSIADTMLSNGYGLECVRLYKHLRRSSLRKALPSSCRPPSVRAFVSAMAGERLLCDRVFLDHDSINESCFADVACDSASQFLALFDSFSKARHPPEKLFDVLALIETASAIYPDMEALFSFPSTASIVAQARSSVDALATSARATMAEFESAVQSDRSTGQIRRCGIHPLNRYVVNYLVLLADYAPVLAEVYAEGNFWRTEKLPDVSVPSPSAGTPATVAMQVAWMVLILLCKVDAKAESYRDVALSYLFLANNVQYVVNKVRGSGLREILGDEWVARHERKARVYAENYVRLGWGKLAAAAVEDDEGTGFCAMFEEACKAGEENVVADGEMREEIRAAVEGMVSPAATAGLCSAEEIRARLQVLFSGTDSR